MQHSKQCPNCSLTNPSHFIQCACGHIFELDQIHNPTSGKGPSFWYFQALKKYAVFGGRAQRKEYWYFSLSNLLIGFVLRCIDIATGIVGLLGLTFALVVFLPGLAVSVRRLHDTGHTGWWVLLNLFPFGGSILFLAFMIRDSVQSNNQYGSNPKMTAL